MLKQSLLIGLCLLVFSCKQRTNTSHTSVQKDHSLLLTKPASRDSILNAGDTGGDKMKHIAYKEDINGLPTHLSLFVPKGFTAIDTTSGDLNLDLYRDMLLVLKKNGEDTSSNEKRPLLILAGQQDGSYKLAARNDNVVYCIDCGGMMGDPFMGVVIKKGYFSIEHYGGSGWRWTRTITFKYSPADDYWLLHKDGGDSFHASDPEKIETAVRTIKEFGKVRFDQYDIYAED